MRSLLRSAVLVATAAVSLAGALPAVQASPAGAQVAQARAATAQYHDFSAATDAGRIELFDLNNISCIDNPAGAMGVHYVDLSLVPDGEVDATQPEAVIYEPQADGTNRLVAVEYVVLASQWAEHHTGTPSLFGQPFELVHAGNRYGLPDFYELHAWLWRNNPAGMFADWNPQVSCANG